MKFSEQWLREWVNPALDTDQLVAQITMAGLEVDAVETVAGDFSGVVVGAVVSREPHPNADKLSVCQVDDGSGELKQVVCGAPNVAAGQKIPFARVGAVLPGDFKIKKAKLRQVESFGMICSASELGLEEETSEGILVLPTDAPVGEDIRSYLNLDDKIIDVDLTPNRGDCLSIAGLAREVGVLNKMDVQAPLIQPVAAKVSDSFAVEVKAPAACPRYVGRVIRNVNVKAETPLWMQEKLRRSGIRSIDPVVDVTNYVLLELGQPMHAFDLDRLSGSIQVRMAAEGETLELLDGQEVKLTPDTLVIADEQRALAMAGVMGGAASGVQAETRHIFLESAYFDPIAIAGRARAYGLHTDSSHRFERGVDHGLQAKAIERATALLLAVVGGEPGPVIEVASSEHLPQQEPVHLRAARIQQMLGLELATDDVEEILARLGMQIESVADGWLVKAPSYRFDISLEADLIEELARIYGYNRLPTRTPTAPMKLKPQQEAKASLKELRAQLIARGYQEAITYSFVEPKLQQLLDPGAEALALANPISADMSVMRTSLWPGLMKALLHNQNRQQDRIRLFEAGLRFRLQDGKLQQTPALAGIVTGSRYPEGWSHQGEPVDFFDVKGDLEALLAVAGSAEAFRFVPAEHPALHPGQTAAIEHNGTVVGYLGALHPTLKRELDVTGNVYLFECALSALEQGRLAHFKELSRFPEVRRDLALLVDQALPVSSVLDVVREHSGEWLTELSLFDVYQGKGVEKHRKSVALGLTWQHPSRTLNDDEINSLIDQIVSALHERCNATLRS